jgi:hypothetical protein
VAKFILRFHGSGDDTSSDLTRIRSSSGVKVLDEASSRMILVEGGADEVRRLVDEMPDWVAVEERTYQLPDPRHRVKRAPK